MPEKKILFISTFPPKKCGIASFTKDLIDTVNKATPKKTVIEICALDKEKKSISAKEMLDKDTGVILSSARENELAKHAIRILQNPQLRKEISNNAL